MLFKCFIPLIAFLLFHFSAFTQKKIIVETVEKQFTINNDLENGHDVSINLVISNQTKDTLYVPPKYSTIKEVNIRMPPHGPDYFERRITIDDLILPSPQILLPGGSVTITLELFHDLFMEKGKKKLWLYPRIIYLKNNKMISVRSNTIIVNVQ